MTARRGRAGESSNNVVSVAIRARPAVNCTALKSITPRNSTKQPTGSKTLSVPWVPMPSRSMAAQASRAAASSTRTEVDSVKSSGTSVQTKAQARKAAEPSTVFQSPAVR